MLRTDAVVRTVWAKDLEVTTKQGVNGTYEAKQILFRVATDRNYKRSMVVNGQTVTDNPTDYILCRATGAVAQAFSDYCTAKKPDGKLISRHLYLVGHIELYTQPRRFPVEAQLNYNGQLLNVKLETEQNIEGHIFVVDEFEFLDSNPVPKTTVPQGATVTNVTVAPVQATPVQTGQPVQVDTQPVQVQANPVQVNAAGAVGSIANAPIPSVSTDFNTTGTEAPF